MPWIWGIVAAIGAVAFVAVSSVALFVFWMYSRVETMDLSAMLGERRDDEADEDQAAGDRPPPSHN
ncbi:MAG: hypothetical protein OXS35_05545 [Dehalococcoidia bacterium]|nr:hypothetical protein [Dehalococcoidia bacterium]